MIPLAKPFIDANIEHSVTEVLRRGEFILGDNVNKFEKEFADYCGVKHGIGVSSGTSALHLSLLCLDIGKEDEVILPANTYIATAFAVSYCGAKPIFVDIDDSYTINTDLMEEKITSKTKAIIPVHLYGHPCKMDEIMKIANENNLGVVEDASQAHGAEFNGRRVGSFGDVGCFSFYPSKNIMCGGDGGIIVTNDRGINEKLEILRNQGMKEKNVHKVIGYNFRLSEISAAIAREQLKHLDEWNEKRRDIAGYYTKLLGDKVVTPKEKWGKHVYHLYVIRTKKRDKLGEYLLNNNIETGIHYPKPVYKQPCYKKLRSNCPVAEKYSKEVLSLPMFPGLKKDNTEFVAKRIKEFF